MDEGVVVVLLVVFIFFLGFSVGGCTMDTKWRQALKDNKVGISTNIVYQIER